MILRPVVGILLLGLAPGRLAAQHFHRLPATPRTVAYGYYSAAATPVLRIASGDTVEVETLITNRPDRLEAAGVAPADVQQSLRDIVTQVTDRGPGGHILTGPVYVENADSGDVLEVRILRIDLAIPYGYNGCRGFLPSIAAAWLPSSRRGWRSPCILSSVAWAWLRRAIRAG